MFRISLSDLITLLNKADNKLFNNNEISPDSLLIEWKGRESIVKIESDKVETIDNFNFSEWLKDNLKYYNTFWIIELNKFEVLLNYLVQENKIALPYGLYKIIYD